MHEELRSKLLSPLDCSVEEPVLVRLASERSVLDALGSDPDDDLPAVVLAEEGPLRENGGVECETLTPEEDRDVPVRALNRLPSTRFMAGDPMKPPTKTLAGRL